MTEGEKLIERINSMMGINKTLQETEQVQQPEEQTQQESESKRHTIINQQKYNDYKLDPEKTAKIKKAAIIGAIALTVFSNGLLSNIAYMGLVGVAAKKLIQTIVDNIKNKSNPPQIEEENSPKRR